MKFILKHTLPGNVEAGSDLQSILHANNAVILDGTMLPHMAVLEVQHENLQQLRAHLGDQWQLFPEKKYSVPDTRKRIKG